MSGMDWLDQQERDYVDQLRQPKPRAAAQPKGKPKRATPERDAQRAVVSWLRRAGCIVQATFTEQAASERDPGKRARFGQARRASGATTGFPDLTVIAPGGRTFFIEMKSATGRLTKAQIEVHADMRRRGCIVLLGRDIWSVQHEMDQAGIVLMRAAVPAEGLRR